MFIHWVARRRASRGSLSRGGRARDAPPRPQMATRRPSTAPAGSRRAWLCMRWPFRQTRGSRGYLRSHSFAVIRAQNGRSEVRDRVWTKQRTAFDLFSAARSGLAVVLRSRGARAVDSCRASGSKAAPRAGRTASGACQRPRGTSSKHALHRGGTRTGSLAGGAVPAASMVAALPQPPRASARRGVVAPPDAPGSDCSAVWQRRGQGILRRRCAASFTSTSSTLVQRTRVLIDVAVGDAGPTFLLNFGRDLMLACNSRLARVLQLALAAGQTAWPRLHAPSRPYQSRTVVAHRDASNLFDTGARDTP